MNKLQDIISGLQNLADSGETHVNVYDLLKIAYSERMAKEWEAREQIIWGIVRAKRQAGFRSDCKFFEDVWPLVLKVYLDHRDEK
jgi:hypothetical protein